MSIDLDAIEQRANAATEGPWKRRGEQWIDGAGYDEVIAPANVECMAYCYGGLSRIEITEADAEFIAHAREDVPNLIRELRETEHLLAVAVREAVQARGEVERLRAQQSLQETWLTTDCQVCDDKRASALPFPENLSHRMIVCPECGNKRCPKATYHGHDCTGSNKPGQVGSTYGYICGTPYCPCREGRWLLGDAERHALAAQLEAVRGKGGSAGSAE